MSELKQQIAEILRTTPYGNGVMAPLERIMEVVEGFRLEERLDELSYVIADERNPSIDSDFLIERLTALKGLSQEKSNE